jgi:16S rRNA (uracil1498-N3)-methyltransferase
VLRIGAGDRLRLFDGLGRECEAEVLTTEGFVCRIAAHETIDARARRLTLVIALPKGKKLDTIIRMVTELGVHAVRLAITERTIARPDAERGEHRVERLQRIAEEACAQSGQTHVPIISPPASLLEVARHAPATGWKVVLWEESATPLDHACFTNSATLPDDVWLVIGPEGGLAAAEIRALEALGFIHASLGQTVLRVDTAAVVGVAAALDRLGLLCR